MKKLILLMSMAMLAGCSTYAIDRYSISADNVTALRALGDIKINVGEFTSTKPNLREVNCRAVGPIKTPDGDTFAHFIQEAFTDELQIAELYSTTAPVTITGNLDHIGLSSMSGKWDLTLTVNSTNGQSVSVSDSYSYTTSFFGETACNQAAQSLMPAVQNVISKVITNPDFAGLVK